MDASTLNMRKRSKYRPKPLRMDNINYVLTGMKLLDETPEGVTLRIKNHDALNNIRKGEGTRDDIDKIIAAFNMTEALACMGIGNDWLAEIKEAQDALLTLARRGVAKDYRFILTGPELQAMNQCMEIHDAQLEVATIQQLEQAMDIVNKVISQRKARPIVQRTKESV